MHFLNAQLWPFLGGAVILTAIAAGCGGKAPPPEFMDHLVPVVGKVTMNGQPLGGATVTFHPADSRSLAVTAYGATNPDGTYEMTTIAVGHGPQEGAVEGDYVVTISKIAMQDGSPIPAEMTEADAEAEGAREVVPPQYSQLDHSRLKAQVASGSGVHDFDL